MAHKINSPVLLTDFDKINESTLKEIQRLKAKNTLLIGGDKSISQSQESNLLIKGFKVKRISGKDRIDTSFEIAKEISNIKNQKNLTMHLLFTLPNQS